MELLCPRQTISDLPVSHAAKIQDGKAPSTGPQAEAVEPTNKCQVQANGNL